MLGSRHLSEAWSRSCRTEPQLAKPLRGQVDNSTSSLVVLLPAHGADTFRGQGRDVAASQPRRSLLVWSPGQTWPSHGAPRPPPLSPTVSQPALVPWFDLDQHRFWVGAPSVKVAQNGWCKSRPPINETDSPHIHYQRMQINDRGP